MPSENPGEKMMVPVLSSNSDMWYGLEIVGAPDSKLFLKLPNRCNDSVVTCVSIYLGYSWLNEKRVKVAVPIVFPVTREACTMSKHEPAISMDLIRLIHMVKIKYCEYLQTDL